MKGKILNLRSVGAVYTHTHTSSFIEKEENKKLWNKSQSILSKTDGISYQDKPSVSHKVATDGITLVALVVTIVVLLILAGITIMYVMSDNGIFKQALNAKEQTERSTFEERLGLVAQDAFIERAKNGGLSPDEYFAILQKHGIISDLTVDGGNIASPTKNLDGSKTYEIISDDDYIFEATIYPDGKVETEVIGKDGNIEAKIRSILVTNKTKDSVSIRVLARLQGGTAKAYYKKASEVVAGEPEDSTAGYTEITLNNNLEGTASPLTAGEEYKIKAILEKDGKVVSVKTITETAKPLVLVESITVNKASLTLEVEGKETLTATIKPDDADNKNVTWSSKVGTIATVSQTGEITGVKAGETTITVTAQDNGKKSASCKVTVIEKGAIPYSWEELGKIAEAISNTTTYKETTTTSISVEVDGDTKTLKVGDWTRIDGRRVRILGFNHDTLTTSTAYNGKVTATGKAGISFEFLDCLMESTAMHGSNDNSNGWVTKSLYTTLNNTTNGKYKDLQNAGIPIKQVQKTYNATYNKSDPKTSSDYLWLLSCAEIWGNSAYTGCISGYSMAKEGEQYAFYANLNPKPVYGSGNTNVVHYNSAGTSGRYCWLRSPYYSLSNAFCCVNTDGNCGNAYASGSLGVSPGFSI